MIFPITALMDEPYCAKWLLRHLHPKGLRCPQCQADLKRARAFRISRRTHITDHRCRQCGTVYNLYTGTVFARKQLRPRQVILLLRGVCKGEPSMTISQELGVTWRTVHEMRRLLHQNAYRMLPQTPVPDANTETDARSVFQNAGEKRRKT